MNPLGTPQRVQLVCPACRSSVVAAANYCHTCGLQLRELCTACGRGLPDGARFCPECGARAVEGGPDPQPLVAFPTAQPSPREPGPWHDRQRPASFAPDVHRTAAFFRRIRLPRLAIPQVSPTVSAALVLAGAVASFLGAATYASRGERGAGILLYQLSAVLVALGLALGPVRRAAIAEVSLSTWPLRRTMLGAGIALVLAGLVLLDRGVILVGSIAWLLSLFVLPLAFVERLRLALPRPSRQGWLELGAVALLLAVGAVYRFVALADFPTGIHGDEAEFGLLSARTLRGEGPYPFGVAFLGDPALFVYVNAVGVALLGQTMEAIRAVAAVSGWLTLPAIYWLARQMFGVPTALLALAFLATNHTHVHFSRLALNVPQVALFAILGLAALWMGLSRGRPVWWVLAGIFGALSLYFHFGARPIPLVYGAIFAYLIATQPSFRRSFWLPVGLTLLGALAAIGPMGLYFLRDPHVLNEHMNARLIFNDWERASAANATSDPRLVLWGQILKNLLLFVNPLPPATFYPAGGDAGAVAPLAPFVVLGFVMAVVRWRDPRYGMALLWLVGYMAAGVISIDAPQPHRLIAVIPLAMVLAAEMAAKLVRIAPVILGPRGRPALAGALAGLALLVGVEDARAYFVRSAASYPWSDVTLQARYVAAQSPGTDIMVAGAHFTYAGHGTTRYLAGHLGAHDIMNLPLELQRLEGSTQPLTFVVNTGLREWLPIIKTYYPGGVEEPRVDGRGDVKLLGYRLPASAVPRVPAMDTDEGLQVAVRPEGGGRTRTWVDPFVAYREAALLADKRPYAATWTGRLVVDRPGEYELELYTSGVAQLLVDGRVVLENRQEGERRPRAQVRLGPSQSVELRYTYRGGPGILELYWRPPDGQRGLVPPGALRGPAGG